MPVQAQEPPIQSEEQATAFYLVSPTNLRERIRIMSVREFCQSQPVITHSYKRVTIPGDFASMTALYIWVAEQNAARC